ncbi:glycosyltransferase [Hankyongella ginsenosidimutans]|uniref:glycosyltransferase n=1 Tax=Hankyongella ginsenosidimutans TaxID=1763828 RepID=UPI001CA374C7|nr:glycosyltransferase [Hankyongella ginsenosidimutans]
MLSGLPPFDMRVAFLNALTGRNAMIYHNSWHDWTGANQPRRYGPLTGLAIDGWRRLTAPPTRLVCISPAAQAGLGAFAGQTPHLIPHAVEDAFGVVVERPQDQPLNVLYVGFLETRKGIGEVLACAERMPHLRFTVLGDGPRRPEVEAAAAAGRLAYHGHVKDRARILEIFRAHDVLLLPSRRTPTWEELFGRVIIEAMATGMPVAASDHIGPKLLISPASTGNCFRRATSTAMSAGWTRWPRTARAWRRCAPPHGSRPAPISNRRYPPPGPSCLPMRWSMRAARARRHEDPAGQRLLSAPQGWRRGNRGRGAGRRAGAGGPRCDRAHRIGRPVATRRAGDLDRAGSALGSPTDPKRGVARRAQRLLNASPVGAAALERVAKT